MKRSLLVQTLLDMATGSGGAKLEALVVDAAGTFDAGSGKGYNPVTVPSGSINVLGEKGVVSNNSVVVTPKARVVSGWLNSGETSGSGVGVTASELVSGTLNVSSDGVQDVTNYQNISVPSGGHSASGVKGTVSNHSVSVTPRSTATAGFIANGSVDGTPVSVSASELVSGKLDVTQNGVFDVTNYKEIEVSGIVTKDSFGSYTYTHTGATTPHSLPGFPNPNNLSITDYNAFLFHFKMEKEAGATAIYRIQRNNNTSIYVHYVNYPEGYIEMDSSETESSLDVIVFPSYIDEGRLYAVRDGADTNNTYEISVNTLLYFYSRSDGILSAELFGLRF